MSKNGYENEFRDLEVFEGAVLEVYRDGRIRTKDFSMTRSDGKPLTRKGVFLSQRPDRDGYMRVTVSKRGKYRGFGVHRLVALAWLPNPENKETVNHLDGNKSNNHVDNLEWATHVEQKIHALETGLSSMDRLLASTERRSIPVEFNGKVYSSLREASRAEGLHRNTIKKRGRIL